MSMFTAHIAIMLEVIGIAAGLVLLHYSALQKAKLLKWAGLLLVIVGTSGFLCTIYYSAKYFLHGHFQHANDFQMTIEGNGPHYHCSGSIGD
jgi:hypothetical protein